MNDDDDVWYFQTDIPALAADLRLASVEIQKADCPGNINADIPAMVLTDLAALAVEQWEGETPALSRAELLATICGGLGYMLDWFESDADDAELKRLRAATDALDALTKEDLRPRLGKVPGASPDIVMQGNQTRPGVTAGPILSVDHRAVAGGKLRCGRMEAVSRQDLATELHGRGHPNMGRGAAAGAEHRLAPDLAGQDAAQGRQLPNINTVAAAEPPEGRDRRPAIGLHLCDVGQHRRMGQPERGTKEDVVTGNQLLRGHGVTSPARCRARC